MDTSIEQLKIKISKIENVATERSYYPLLCSFLEDFAKNTVKLRDPRATPEETSTQYDHRVGFPDITIRNGEILVGCVEVKTPVDDLKSERFSEQFERYKSSIENIIITNLREWQLWQWVREEGKDKPEPKLVSKLIFDLTIQNPTGIGEFELLLTQFFEGRTFQTRTPHQLALVLARKTQLLSKQVEEALIVSDEGSDLKKLKDAFEKTLIQDIADHQFANMVAETMAYSLFLAALEHSQRDMSVELTLTNAIDYLPKNVPILRDLYDLVKKIVSPTIRAASQLLVDQLNASEIGRVRQKLVEHKPGEDPVIQFYEPFLKEYDPKEREARGVYYTPKPVVDYIVKNVDWLLRNKFDKAKGLADESVHLLDPATGTGTFLMSAIQEIYGNVKKENINQGEEMVQKEFNKIVINHILKHFYGFELMVAPYAIAHLKLTLLMENLGFNFEMTKNDSDPDNDRLKIYLANTLDDPDKPPQDFFGFNSIPAESEKARDVKKNVPILVITGNPPYSNFGRMNQGDWILALLKDYKKDLNETKINLDDDFIKFIRFAQWKLEQTGQGIFAMITSNTFIDGLTHRQMRRSLMDTFDEVYIYNLHGNLRKGEICPDGSKDENVFDIQTGVSINFFIKHEEKYTETNIYYCDLWGLREEKFAMLLGGNFNKTDWQQLLPKSPNWFFVEKDSSNLDEYEGYTRLPEVFNIFGSGVKTERDKISIHYDKNELISTLNDFQNLDELEIRHNYDLPEDSRDWKILKAKADVVEHNADESLVKTISYRPFDWQYVWYSGKSRGFVGTPGYPTMKHLLHPNLGLVATRQLASYKYFVMFVTNKLIEISSQPFAPNNVFPLYVYNNSASQMSLLGVGGEIRSKPNLSLGFIKEFSGKLGMAFLESGRGDLDKNFGPEDVFYYTYAVFHSPTYRTRYAEQLKIDFPRLPLTASKELFKTLVAKGTELVNLHLLGENPFDKTKTIFDEPEKWDVKIGVTKTKNLEDWKVSEVRYDALSKRVYVNPGQYFQGVENEVWEFMIGGYQVCEKWLKDRKKAERILSTDDLKHYMKIIVSLRETIRIMKEIDQTVPNWPIS